MRKLLSLFLRFVAKQYGSFSMMQDRRIDAFMWIWHEVSVVPIDNTIVPT